jgi:predicted transcriptional regulator of viral defense system
MLYNIVNMIEQVSKRQRRLATLMRSTPGTIHIDDAMKALNLTRQQASQLLASWHKQGVLRRVSHGLYVPVQPSALGQTQVLEDPWILVPELFEPGYIGGWSAAEYWEFTEQIFRTVCVLTHKRTSYGDKQIQGVNFFIKYVSQKLLFGTKSIWRDHMKIQISDPHKTILDILDEPKLGAGLQHTLECFKEYARLYRDNRYKLIEYAKKINNGALFKKLGYFAEKLDFDEKFLDTCKKSITKGYTRIEPIMENKRLMTRWRLWVPEHWVMND